MSNNSMKSWPVFCLIISGIVFVRGLLLLCVYPPLEGCDEYQHIAYMVFISENGSLPVLNKDFVPESLYPDLIENPHSDFDVQQTGHIGCLSYKDFYSRAPNQTGSGKIWLYQAQHPPLFYLAFNRIYSTSRLHFGFRQTITLIRMINLLMATAGFFFFLLPVKKLFVSSINARLTALAISVAPMPLIYTVRVSNDASAFFIAALVFSILATLENGEKFILKCAAIAFLISMGIWVKLTVFMYLPVTAVYMLYTTIFNDIPLRKIVMAVLIIGLIYAGIGGTYHRRVLLKYDTPLLSQEAVKNKANGETLQDTLNHSEWSHLNTFLLERMLKGSLWQSGWSFLRTLSTLVNSYVSLLFLGLCGVVPLLFIRFRDRKTFPPSAIHIWVLSGIVSVLAFSAAYFHALNSIASYGEILTPGYYLAPGYPVFIAWIMASYQGFKNQYVLRFGAIALTLLFIFTELYSAVFIAMPHWAGSHDFTEIVTRIAAVHALFPGPFLLAPLVGIYIVMLMMAVVAIRGSDPSSSQNRQDK